MSMFRWRLRLYAWIDSRVKQLSMSLVALLTGAWILFFNGNDAADRIRPLIAHLVPLERRLFESMKYQERKAQQASQCQRRGACDFIFLGDSHTQYFDLKEYFQDVSPANFGIAGDTALGVLTRLSTDIPSVKARRVFIMVGYNDIKYRDTAEIVNYLRRIVLESSHKFDIPAAALLVQSLFPVARERAFVNAKIIAINHAIKSMCTETGCTYLEVHGEFADADGALRVEYSAGSVHLNAAGYARWAGILQPSFIRF